MQPDPEPGDGDGPPEPKPEQGRDAQIRALLAEADEKFAAADKAQREGDTVRWARLMDEARGLIEDAIELAE